MFLQFRTLFIKKKVHIFLFYKMFSSHEVDAKNKKNLYVLKRKKFLI